MTTSTYQPNGVFLVNLRAVVLDQSGIARYGARLYDVYPREPDGRTGAAPLANGVRALKPPLIAGADTNPATLGLATYNGNGLLELVEAFETAVSCQC